MKKSLPGCDGRWCWFWHSLFLRPAGWRQEGKASQIKSYRIILVNLPVSQVYAVEASSIAVHATKLVAANKVDEVIKVS